MKRFMIICLVLCGCSSESTLEFDASIPDIQLDIAPVDMAYDTKDTYLPDKSQPDFGIHKCSPAGYYTFNVSITKNTCPSSIVSKTAWTTTAFMKSYWCGTHFVDQYSTINDKVLYCAYYTKAESTGLEQWAECVVYEVGRVEYCVFNFGAPFTVPNR